MKIDLQRINEPKMWDAVVAFITLVCFLAIFGLPKAHATDYREKPQVASPSYEQSQDQGQSQTQIDGQNQTQTNDVSARSDSTASNQGVQAGSQYSNDSSFLALSAAQGRAAAVSGCHESKGGFSVIVGSGGNGKVEINEPCLRFEQCMARAEFYLKAGRRDMALEQLHADDCGGLEVKPEPSMCEESADRALRECVAK